MYDAVTPTNIPRTGSTLIAGYADGLYANLAALRARFPNEQVVPIAVSASYPAAKGYVLDCENGDATNAQAVAWCQKYPGSNTDLTIYTNSDNLSALRSALAVLSTQPNIWVAHYDGVATIPAGCVAKQYATGTYDKSVVVDSPHWPGVDTAAAKPPAPATGAAAPAVLADWAHLQTVLAAVPEKVYEGYNSSAGWDNDTAFGVQYGENFVSWCVIFDWDVYSDAGFASVVPKTDNVSSFTSWAKARGQWSEYPSVGAWVNFGNGAHTEMVTGFDAANVYTKGGNSVATGATDNGQGNGVFSHSHARSDSYVVGYFAPKYPDGICPPTADPADYRGGKAVTSYRFKASTTPPPVNEPVPVNTKIGDDETMWIITYPKGSGWKGDFLLSGGKLTHLKTEASETALKRLGVQTKALTTADFNALYALLG